MYPYTYPVYYTSTTYPVYIANPTDVVSQLLKRITDLEAKLDKK